MNEIFIILALIVVNGIFAMSEIALISARKSSLGNDAKKGSKSAKVALKLANEPDRFLSTIQIGITLVGILTGVYSGDVLAKDFSTLLIGWGMSEYYANLIARPLIVIAVTYLTLIFGELVPKRLGMSVAEKAAKIVARPMNLLSVIATPFVWILSKSTSFVVRLMNIKSSETVVTEDEIKDMIQEGKETGAVQEVEQDIVERVFLLGDRKVNSIMTPRNDIVWIDVNMTKEQIKDIVCNNLYEVYPVASGSLDSVEGVVYLKDLFGKIDDPEFDLSSLVKPVTYFHENMDVYKALAQMQEKHISQALVADEFGSCQGIVTLKDILEGLIGTINDSRKEPDIVERQDNGGWLVDGQCSFYDFVIYFDVEDLYAPDGYTTVGGLVLELLEHIPTEGEKVKWHMFTFEVVDMDGVRIDKILVTKES